MSISLDVQDVAHRTKQLRVADLAEIISSFSFLSLSRGTTFTQASGLIRSDGSLGDHAARGYVLSRLSCSAVRPKIGPLHFPGLSHLI